MLTVYRHAAWDTPWWVNPNRSAGRWNAWGDPPVQYWCTHPLGPAAELLRWQGPLSQDELADLRLRIWVARIARERLAAIDFATAHELGVEPGELVGEDHRPTQALARRLRNDGAEGLLVPSAALPGTEVVVLFGARLLFPYLLEPIDPEQVATGHVADGGVPPEVLPHIRWQGIDHAGLDEWRATGAEPGFMDPAVPRLV